MLDKTTLIAEALTRSGALKFGNFKLKSGITSPYYIDMTWLLSSPEDFELVVNLVAEEIKAYSSSTRIDKLASIELKGALLLPSIAGKLKMPCVVVRKEKKAYGLTGRLAGGEVEKGERLVFFDDLVTSGESKLEGIKPLEQAGGKIEAILVVVDREQGGRENLERVGYKVKALATITDLVRSLRTTGTLSEDRADEILRYLKE